MTDKNNTQIQIGDIVKVSNSPIKSDNALYVVVQDGTSDLYLDRKSITMYRVAKIKNGFTLSIAKYTTCFFPLTNYSSRYKYSRAEMDAGTIEIIIKATPEAFRIVKVNENAVEFAPNEKDVYFAQVTQNGNRIKDVSYLVSQSEKLTAFFSNLVLRERQILTIVKQMHNDDLNHYGKCGADFEIRKIDAASENNT